MLREDPVGAVLRADDPPLWNGSVGLIPVPHGMPEGLVCVSLPELAPSQLVVAWRQQELSLLVASFVRIRVAGSAALSAARG